MDKIMSALAIITGAAGIVIVSLFAVIVLWNIFTRRIDLKYLLSEKNGKASLSRFQFLVFTFVIGFALVYVTLKNGKLPDIGASVMALLGISGGSYVVSKGIQRSNEQAADGITTTYEDNKTTPTTAAGGTGANAGGWKVNG